jgi:hypothetical protein
LTSTKQPEAPHKVEQRPQISALQSRFYPIINLWQPTSQISSIIQLASALYKKPPHKVEQRPQISALQSRFYPIINLWQPSQISSIIQLASALYKGVKPPHKVEQKPQSQPFNRPPVVYSGFRPTASGYQVHLSLGCLLQV